MDGEMKSTIEKIKLQEQDNETKLKEKRAIEATLASLKRNLLETMMVTNKVKEELKETTARTDDTKVQLVTAQALLASLAAQLEASDKQLQQLKINSELGIAKVWEQRNVLCNQVHTVSDQCDVWALFTKPKYIEPTNKVKKTSKENGSQVNQQTGLLDSAQKKLQSLSKERDRLLNEPEFGEEFKRIKNAIHYSTEMAAQNVKG